MINERNNDNDEFINPMKDHFKDPSRNSFLEDGLTIEIVKERNPRVWLSYPQGLKKNAIHNIMKQFGQVVSIFVPVSGINNKRVFAFIQYATFKEAEKAIREINSSNKDGLDLRADFAHAKTTTEKCQNENFPQVPPEIPIQEVIEEEVPETQIYIDLNSFKSDESIEKVSQFEFKGPIKADLNDCDERYLAKCAEKSLGEYDENENCFEYNMTLKENNFLTFYCCVCDQEAALKCEISHRYFCSKECADAINKEIPDTQVKSYKFKESDKVCLTAIINEKSLYIRPYDEDINFILESVYRKARITEPLKHMPIIGDQVIVSLFDSLYRAVVLRINDQDHELLVRLTDIGNTARVNINSVFEMNEECMKIKVITANVTLRDVNVEAINNDVIDYLTNLLYNNVELVIKDIDENGVELKDNSTKSSINDKICKLSNFEHVRFEDLDYVNNVPDLIPIGVNQKLFVVNAGNLKSIGGICCVAEKYVKDFHEFYRSLNTYGKKVDLESYGFNGNKPLCLIKYNNQWHRGIVNKAEGDGRPECVLIDVQHVSKIKVENIFKLPEVLAKFPFVSDIYKIEGYDTNDDVKKHCDENVTDNSFICAKKVEVKDDFPVIHIM